MATAVGVSFMDAIQYFSVSAIASRCQCSADRVSRDAGKVCALAGEMRGFSHLARHRSHTFLSSGSPVEQHITKLSEAMSESHMGDLS